MKYIALFSVVLVATVVADDVNCRGGAAGVYSPSGCTATIEANLLGKCPGGYVEEYAQAPRYPGGIYCNRACTPEEADDCRKKGCASYTSNCRSGTSTACALAVQNCGGIVSDDVCRLSGTFSKKCQYTNKCQSRLSTCCPTAEDNENYVLGFHNIVMKERKTVGILSSLCGFMDLSPFEELCAKYVAAGNQVKRAGDSSQVGFGCKDVKQTRVVYNKTRTVPEDQNAVARQLMLDCEDVGGVYRFTKAG